MTRHKKFSRIGYIIEDVKNIKKPLKGYKNIAIHHSASPRDRGDTANTIDRWHLKRWGIKSGCGYHFVITGDGTIQEGRSPDFSGAHVKGRNNDTLGICVIGDDNIILGSQLSSLIALVDHLTSKDMLNVSIENVKGHGEFTGAITDCPGFDPQIVRDGVTSLTNGDL